jgi:CRP-like cAMP-binding protein
MTSIPPSREHLGTVSATWCSELARLPHAALRRLAPRRALPVDGEPGTSIYLLGGALGLELIDAEQHRVIVEVFGRADCVTDVAHGLGRATVVGLPVRAALVALAPATILQLPTRVLLDQMRLSSALATSLSEWRVRQYASWLERMAVLRLRLPVRRVAGTLLYLLDKLEQNAEAGVERSLHLTQHVIAAVADLSRQTSNRELQRLQHAGIVAVSRGLVRVVDENRLRAVYRGELPLVRVDVPSLELGGVGSMAGMPAMAM